MLIVLTSVTHHVLINLTQRVLMSAILIISTVKTFALASRDAQMVVTNVKLHFASAKIRPIVRISSPAR